MKDVHSPNPLKESKWWIDDYGQMCQLPSGKLPACLSREQEDEWVEIETELIPWQNKYGFYLKNPRKIGTKKNPYIAKIEILEKDNNWMKDELNVLRKVIQEYMREENE